MTIDLCEVDRVEILTLQDNYINLVSADDSGIIHRAKPPRGFDRMASVLAEHGFSVMVSLFHGDRPRRVLFDFGLSAFGAAHNAEVLDVDLSTVEALILSHGHIDHLGGLKALTERLGRRGVDLVAHPSARRSPRYLKLPDDKKVPVPSLSEHRLEEAGVNFIPTEKPYLLVDGSLLFLGQIPRRTGFEKGIPNAYYEDEGQEKWDDLEDDSAVAAHLKGRGLVVLSGCSHAGIINTVQYARQVTGIDQVHLIMGGFHLAGPHFVQTIEPTVAALKEIDPDFIIPTHCTGRRATLAIEQALPDRFILNMAGTRLTFSA